MSFCTDCGSEVDDGWRFCRSCGTPQPVLVDDMAPASGRSTPLVATPQPFTYPPPRRPGPSLSALRTLGTWIQVVLWVCAAVSALLLAFALAAHAAYDRLVDSVSPGSLGDAVAANDAFELAIGSWILVSLAAGVAFIVWLYQAGRYVRREGRSGGRFGPGWAIGGWFIPLANLVLPALYASELWRMSDPAVRTDDPEGWRHRPIDGKLWTWWGMFSVAAILFSIGLAQTDDATLVTDRSPWMTQYKFTAVAMVLYVAAGAVGALLVRHLTERLSSVGADPAGR